MTATFTRIHPGRPPAAPAPTHACEPVRDVWGMRDGTLLWCVTCRWCGRSMPEVQS